MRIPENRNPRSPCDLFQYAHFVSQHQKCRVILCILWENTREMSSMMNIMLRSHRVKYLIETTQLYRSLTTKGKNLRNDQLCDTIGPPDSVSNIRPIVFARPVKETYLQKRHRQLREETQRWHQAFWFKHNTAFVEERKQFQESLRAQGKITLNADDMSVFYKQFLDKNWRSHVDYNFAWYKRNVKILFLGIAAKVSQPFRFKDKLP